VEAKDSYLDIELPEKFKCDDIYGIESKNRWVTKETDEEGNS
jgi:hypothetical protein